MGNTSSAAQGGSGSSSGADAASATRHTAGEFVAASTTTTAAAAATTMATESRDSANPQEHVALLASASSPSAPVASLPKTAAEIGAAVGLATGVSLALLFLFVLEPLAQSFSPGLSLMFRLQILLMLAGLNDRSGALAASVVISVLLYLFGGGGAGWLLGRLGGAVVDRIRGGQAAPSDAEAARVAAPPPATADGAGAGYGSLDGSRPTAGF